MLINKIGNHHLVYGENCQNMAVQEDSFKCVCDCCGSGKHSEIEIKLFSFFMLQNGHDWDECF